MAVLGPRRWLCSDTRPRTCSLRSLCSQNQSHCCPDRLRCSWRRPAPFSADSPMQCWLVQSRAAAGCACRVLKADSAAGRARRAVVVTNRAPAAPVCKIVGTDRAGVGGVGLVFAADRICVVHERRDAHADRVVVAQCVAGAGVEADRVVATHSATLVASDLVVVAERRSVCACSAVLDSKSAAAGAGRGVGVTERVTACSAGVVVVTAGDCRSFP